MRKIVFTLIFTFFINILPLLFRPELLLHYKAIIVLIGGLAMFLTQPAFSMEETLKNKTTDRFSILIILFASGISVSSSLVEWAYFNNRSSVLFFTAMGIFMIGAGLVLRISAILTLGKFFTATARVTKEHVLVKTGPYSIIRHPSYAGAIIVMTGVPVLLNNVVTFFSTILLLILAYDIRIKNEEKVLVSIFGDKYRQYTLCAKKIIPYIW
jgi:protein-S-isoprenylcysteine O-methyltransferase Ste14